jgi:hypothetical protein
LLLLLVNLLGMHVVMVLKHGIPNILQKFHKFITKFLNISST